MAVPADHLRAALEFLPEEIRSLSEEQQLEYISQLLSHRHRHLRDKEEAKKLHKKMLETIASSYPSARRHPHLYELAGWKLGSFLEALIHYAASHGNAQVLQNLLADCTEEEIATLSQSSVSPLQLAAQNGHSVALSMLVQRGVKHNSKVASPLHRACYEGHLSVVKLLIKEKVCDVTERDLNGHTPLQVACRKGHTEVVKYFIDDCHVDLRVAGTTTWQSNILHFAVHSSKLDLVQYLVREVRISPASVNDDGVTSLHRAAEHGSTAVLRWLIEGASSDPFVKVRSKGMLAGRTLLHFAVFGGSAWKISNVTSMVKRDSSCY